jgi:N-ethylmaleimide reductase
MTTPVLLSSIRVGPLVIPNRVWMAPLTRSRAGVERVPNALMAEHYRQRASAGLIISEATQISEQGIGYPDTPGIQTPEQVDGWRLVTRAVHDAGGRIVCQLWHVGRFSHPVFQPGGELPVAPSAINPGGEARTADGPKARVTPRALELVEFPRIIEDYRHAARRAKDAGFDGVELHGANGYLPDQFLRDSSNHRTDRYGGSVANRCRFLLEAAEAIIDVWGADRVGVRLSPSGIYNGMTDSDPRGTFAHAVRELAARRVGYLHVMEAMPGASALDPPIPVSFFRPMYDGALVTNGGFTFEKGKAYLREGWCDAIAFGKLFISNPDLPERFRRFGSDAPLTPWDQSTFYTPGSKGYTDYPALG